MSLQKEDITRLSTHCRFSFPGSMMKRMSFSETIFLFFLALVIFGPKKLPEIARQAGKLLNEFRRASNEFKSQIEQEIAHLEVEDKKKTIPQAAQAPAGTTSRTLNVSSNASSNATNASQGELPSMPAPATEASAAASDDEPLFAAQPATHSGTHSAGVNGSEAKTPAPESLPTPEPVTPPTSQESHV
jgi:sec-independent protein translocase protein TatB